MKFIPNINLSLSIIFKKLITLLSKIKINLNNQIMMRYNIILFTSCLLNYVKLKLIILSLSRTGGAILILILTSIIWFEKFENLFI